MNETIYANIMIINFEKLVESIAKKSRYETVPRLLDGKYYEIIKRDNTKIEALCKTCNKVRKGFLTSTGNFMEHLRKSHPELVVEAELYKKQGVGNERNVKNDKHQKTIQEMLKKFTSEEVCICFENCRYFEKTIYEI